MSAVSFLTTDAMFVARFARRVPLAGGGFSAGALAAFQQDYATCAAGSFVIPPPSQDTLSVVSSVDPASSSDYVGGFPVRRVYCVGRNYFDHAQEMAKKHEEMGIGDGTDSRKPPFFFQKPQSGAVVDCSRSGRPHSSSSNNNNNGGIAKVSYPSMTKSLEFECEMVVALKSGGANIEISDA